MLEPRLIGIWKSDRRRTFQQWKPQQHSTPQSLRKFKAMFGKLTLHYRPRTFISTYDGHQERQRYEVVARDSVSVVIRHFDKLADEPRLSQICFEGDDSYVLLTQWGFLEWFRRVKSS